MGKPIYIVVVLLPFIVAIATASQRQVSGIDGDEAITIDPHWEEHETESSVIIQSQPVTDWGSWGRLQHCSATHSYVTGFQLKVEEKETGIDNTALNGIELSCGLPEQKEIERITSRYGPWGKRGDRMFCATGYAVGFQLKVQKPQGRGVDDVATINAKMICENGQILEGWDEKGDYYVDTVWSEPLVCPEKMVVCGIQTQVEPRRFLGDDTSLNNIRLECCSPPKDSQSDESASSSTTYNITLYSEQEGGGESETLEIHEKRCNNFPFQWQKNVSSILKDESVSCIRLYEGLDCSRRTRCYCDLSNHLLSLNDTFKLGQDLSWNRRVRSVGSCYVGKEKALKKHMEAEIYSEKEFGGRSTGLILSPGECLTFYEGDAWHRQLRSVKLNRGCIYLYGKESCTGEETLIENSLYDVGVEWENKTVSVKNCYSQRQTDQ